MNKLFEGISYGLGLRIRRWQIVNYLIYLNVRLSDSKGFLDLTRRHQQKNFSNYVKPATWLIAFIKHKDTIFVR